MKAAGVQSFGHPPYEGLRDADTGTGKAVLTIGAAAISPLLRLRRERLSGQIAKDIEARGGRAYLRTAPACRQSAIWRSLWPRTGTSRFFPGPMTPFTTGLPASRRIRSLMSCRNCRRTSGACR